MVYKTYIIHSSAIIRNGFSRILEKNFRCKVFLFASLKLLKQNTDLSSDDNIYLIQDEIYHSQDFGYFSQKLSQSKIFTISQEINNNDLLSRHTISVEDTVECIIEFFNKIFVDIKSKKVEVLSLREIEILKHVSLGLSNKEIAEKLYISIHTVMSHRKNITEKLGIKSISGLTVYAIINNFLDPKAININELI